MSSDVSAYPGSTFDLPSEGVGSVASMGRKVLAFLIDLALSFGIAMLFTQPELPKNWSLLAWASITIVTVGVFSFTPGQGIVGIRVASTRGKSMVWWWAVPRTALIFVIVPVLIVDVDGRGLHDRWCRTIVVRMR